MSKEDKLATLEEVKDSLVSALNELNKDKKEFEYFINCISDTLGEISEEIEQLEEEQNHIWQKEIDQANREFESMRI